VIIVQYSSYIYQDNDLGLSIISVVLDFAIYNSIFFVLYFLIDNRKRYLDVKVDIKNKHSIRTDAIKIITALGIAEIAYLSVKFISSYVFFASSDIEASKVSLLSTVNAWIVYVVVANLLVRKQNLM
jgi:hypothetical protein